MSCEHCECDRDPVMDILEALAATRGLRLVPIEPTEAQPDPLQALTAEYRAMTDDLRRTLAELKAEDETAMQAMIDWRKAYGKMRLEKRLIDLPNEEHVSLPIDLSLWRASVSTRRSLAVQEMTVRLSNDAMDLLPVRPAAARKPAA